MKSIPQRIKDLPVLKLRASSAGRLSAGITTITELQEKEILELQKKETPTIKQMERLAELIKKRDNPQLSSGAKTFVEEWLWEHLRQKKREIQSKYTAKGLIMEDESIDLASKVFGWDFAMKNEQSFEDDYFKGTPDLFVSSTDKKGELIERVVDIKTPFDETTFKYFNDNFDSDYYWQLQTYMHLTGRRHASLVYVLSNTPRHLIAREVISYCYTMGYDIEKGEDLYDSEIYREFEDKMTFDDLPDKMRIKKFDFEYSEQAIEKLKRTIDACRGYQFDILREKFGYAA